jgi:hypothetical protein
MGEKGAGVKDSLSFAQHSLASLMSFVEVVSLDWFFSREHHGVCVVKQLPVYDWLQKGNSRFTFTQH